MLGFGPLEEDFDQVSRDKATTWAFCVQMDFNKV